MDLETENKIAAILMKEAAELRRQAQREGALAYLRQPTVRSRPNSRFLTATVRGVQQANRVVEVTEMWRLREKQIELDNKLRSRARNESNTRRSYKAAHESSRRSGSNCSDEPESSRSATLASKKRDIQDADRVSHEGLRDEEVDEFLHSRAKRGRGTVGSRMDETGPYLPFRPDSETESSLEKKKTRVVLGPDKPRHLNQPSESSDGELDVEKRREKRRARKGRSTRHGSREKPRHKRKKKRKNA